MRRIFADKEFYDEISGRTILKGFGKLPEKHAERLIKEKKIKSWPLKEITKKVVIEEKEAEVFDKKLISMRGDK